MAETQEVRSERVDLRMTPAAKRTLARRNEAEGASRTFVVCASRRVVGYYSLAAGSLLRAAASGKVRRNMPDPVPILLLGRLSL